MTLTATYLGSCLERKRGTHTGVHIDLAVREGARRLAPIYAPSVGEVRPQADVDGTTFRSMGNAKGGVRVRSLDPPI